MATRDDIVQMALSQNGYHDGQGYDEPSKYLSYFGINYGIAYCDVFVSWVFAQCGVPLPKMGTWISSGSQYVPESWAYAKARGATRPSWLAQPGDQTAFDWTATGAMGPQSHTEIVVKWENGVLHTVGGNSGPSNVDGFKGAGGVHRHWWSAPVGVGNPLIMGVIDTSKLVKFSSEGDEFVMDAEAKAAFADLKKTIQDNASQIVNAIQGGSDATKKFGIEGIKDLDAKVSKVAQHFGVQW